MSNKLIINVDVFNVLVAKRKSLFDDKAVEIEELTYIIKQVSVLSISRNGYFTRVIYKQSGDVFFFCFFILSNLSV